MVTGSFRIELPPDAWIRDVSTGFPEVQFRLLSGIQVENGAVELGETTGAAAVEAAAAVDDHPATAEYETLFADDDRILSQYRTSDRSLYDFLQAVTLPPEFPVVVADGWLECEVTAPRERIVALEEHLRASPLDFELRSIAETPDVEHLLTDRQRELLTAAFASGYYEVPRERTLTDLAEDVGIDPSTASGVLRRAERKIVAWFVASESQASYEQFVR